MSARDRLLVQLAGHLDRIKASCPVSNYEVNIVLVHRHDPLAHVAIGNSDPRDVCKALAATVDNQASSVGMASARGVEAELVAALEGLNAHVEAMQAEVSRYLASGDQPAKLASELIFMLDGPRQRKVQSRARAILQQKGQNNG